MRTYFIRSHRLALHNRKRKLTNNKHTSRKSFCIVLYIWFFISNTFLSTYIYIVLRRCILSVNKDIASLRTRLPLLWVNTKWVKLWLEQSPWYNWRKKVISARCSSRTRWCERKKILVSSNNFYLAQKHQCRLSIKKYVTDTIFNRMIKDSTPRDIAKKIMKWTPISKLVIEIIPVNSVFISANRVQRIINRDYCVIRIAKRTKLRCL